MKVKITIDTSIEEMYIEVHTPKINEEVTVIVAYFQDLNAKVIAITDLEGKPVEKALPGEEYIMKIKITADHHIIYQSQSLAFRIGGKSFMTGIVLGY